MSVESNYLVHQGLACFFQIRGRKATDPSQKTLYSNLSKVFSMLSGIMDTTSTIDNRLILRRSSRLRRNRNVITQLILLERNAYLQGRVTYYYPLQEDRPKSANEIIQREDNEHFKCFFRFTKEQFVHLCEALQIPPRYDIKG